MAITPTIHARRWAHAAVGAAVLATALLGAPAAAQAAEKPLPTCNYDIGTKTTTCVAAGEDLDAAVHRETGLTVVQPGSRQARSATVSPNAVVVISQLYDDANYGGSFLQITWSRSCDGSTIFYYDGIVPNGWSGRVSSFRSFSGCTTKVWQGRYSGAAYGYSVNAASLGAMNDKATTATVK